MGIEIKLLLIEGIVIIGLNILFAFLALAHIEKKPHTVLPDPFYYVILNSLIFPLLIPFLNYYYLPYFWKSWSIMTLSGLSIAWIGLYLFFKIIKSENPQLLSPVPKGIDLKKICFHVFYVTSLSSSILVILIHGIGSL